MRNAGAFCPRMGVGGPLPVNPRAGVSSIGFKAMIDAMAPATKAAIVFDFALLHSVLCELPAAEGGYPGRS